MQALYENAQRNLPFHGWHHIEFVYKHSAIFAEELGADKKLVALAALTHDLNYVVDTVSNAATGRLLRSQVLQQANISAAMIEKIEGIVQSSDIRNGHKNLSQEAKALTDADTLYKSLPITPILFAHEYMKEQGIHVAKLADFIMQTQKSLLEEDRYFFSNAAKKYLPWAKTNFELWRNIHDYLNNYPELAVEGV